MNQHTTILNILLDKKVHCLTNELFMKDDRSRISELRRKKYVFNEEVGVCKIPDHKHRSAVKLRQLIREPDKYIEVTPKTFKNLNFHIDVKVQPKSEEYCQDCKYWLDHSTNCLSLTPVPTGQLF